MALLMNILTIAILLPLRAVASPIADQPKNVGHLADGEDSTGTLLQARIAPVMDVFASPK
ncbi:hypothetical protein JMJ78_0000916 [Colletotrichum scovillei]|nr:hypothetical protein JMJ78_0000916 [Colletotrichum scovillei]